MADPKETVVGEWMVKAERDLASVPGGRPDGDGRAAKNGACLFAISGCNV